MFGQPTNSPTNSASVPPTRASAPQRGMSVHYPDPLLCTSKTLATPACTSRHSCLHLQPLPSAPPSPVCTSLSCLHLPLQDTTRKACGHTSIAAWWGWLLLTCQSGTIPSQSRRARGPRNDRITHLAGRGIACRRPGSQSSCQSWPAGTWHWAGAAAPCLRQSSSCSGCIPSPRARSPCLQADKRGAKVTNRTYPCGNRDISPPSRSCATLTLPHSCSLSYILLH